LDSFTAGILEALVEGYTARAGLKERLQALSEWEIARRSGYSEASYAEWARHPDRGQLTDALAGLARAGLVEVRSRGVHYDSFIPTPAGIAHLAGRDASGSSNPRL
jgi:hypothetical protein